MCSCFFPARRQSAPVGGVGLLEKLFQVTAKRKYIYLKGAILGEGTQKYLKSLGFLVPKQI